MAAFARSFFAIVAGAVVAGLLIAVIEKLGHTVYPPPADVDFSDADAIRAYTATLPVGAFVFVLAGWGVGTLVGATLAGRLAGRAPGVHVWIVTGLLLAGGVANMIMLPHPLWFAVTATLIFLAAGAAAMRVANARMSNGGER